MVKSTISTPCHKEKQVAISKFECIESINVFLFNDQHEDNL